MTNQKTIIIAASSILVLTVFILTTKTISLNQELKDTNQILQDTRQELQKQIDSIKDTKATDQISKEEAATKKDIEEPKKYKTYTSNEGKISFEYPEQFSISEEIKNEFPDGEKWIRISLTRELDDTEEYIMIEVNPDGYGPIFADKAYTLEEQIDNTVKIVKQTVEEKDENNDDEALVIVTNVSAANKNSYYLRLYSPTSSEDIETIFQNLISSIRILD